MAMQLNCESGSVQQPGQRPVAPREDNTSCDWHFARGATVRKPCISVARILGQIRGRMPTTKSAVRWVALALLLICQVKLHERVLLGRFEELALFLGFLGSRICNAKFGPL